MIAKQKFVYSDHLSITNRHPNRHIAYYHPPSIGDELTRGNLKFIQDM